MSVASDRGLPRGEPEENYEVTPLELFFDLVFVFAVSQLSHHLLEHLTWRGAGEVLVLLLPILAVWSYTSWAATMIPADRPATLWMILSVMLVGLFMNAAAANVFTTTGWPFVVPFLLIQLGRTVWTIANAPDAKYRDHFVRVLIWFIVTTPLWIAGAAVGPKVRVFFWGLAAAIDLAGTWLAHPVRARRLHSAQMAFAGGHMLERCRLFLIIALGETVLTTGTAIAAVPFTAMTVTTGTAALAGTVALWGLCFGRSDRLTVQHLKQTRDPVRTSRFAINALTVMVLGLIAVAVGNEKAIAHPNEHGPPSLSALLYGGPILFLLAQGWYLRTELRSSPRVHLFGCVVLLGLGIVSLAASASVALVVMAASLAALAVIERR
ncbi:MAG TPA: low temperature requirement protein A [Vicinamibacterales bacterium]|jgi:low temperature requirement protein LtrA